MNNLIPSWLTSWVAWRNYYTKKDQQPFQELIDEFGLERLPTSGEYLSKHDGHCPHCHGDYVVMNNNLGLVYCLCKVLEYIYRMNEINKFYRTTVGDAYLKDLTFPTAMGYEYKRTMSIAISEVTEFIRYPDSWLVIVGAYGYGKTHLLKAINTAYKPIALYVSAREFETQAHKFRKEDTLTEYINALITAPILLIDDVGMDYNGKMVNVIFDQVIDGRYEKWPEGLTIISTNLQTVDLATLHRRAYDRMFDNSRSKYLAIIASKSYRLLDDTKKSAL